MEDHIFFSGRHPFLWIFAFLGTGIRSNPSPGAGSGYTRYIPVLRTWGRHRQHTCGPIGLHPDRNNGFDLRVLLEIGFQRPVMEATQGYRIAGQFPVQGHV